MHRLNMEVDLQSLFGLHVSWCAHSQMFSLAETPQLTPSPRIWTRITRALLVSKDRRHLFVTPESVATLPPFSPIEGQKWFDQISSQWESQKNRFALIYFGKIQFLPPCIWNLPFMSTASGVMSPFEHRNCRSKRARYTDLTTHPSTWNSLSCRDSSVRCL